MGLSEMKFPPVKNAMLKEYPEMADYDELKKADDTLLRYLSFFCDQNSVIDTPDFDLRVSKCRERSGYKGSIDSSEFLSAMYRFFYLIDDLRMESWVSNRMAFAQFMHQIRKPIDDKDAEVGLKCAILIGKCWEQATKIETEIREIESHLFPTKKVSTQLITHYSKSSSRIEDLLVK